MSSARFPKEQARAEQWPHRAPAEAPSEMERPVFFVPRPRRPPVPPPPTRSGDPTRGQVAYALGLEPYAI